MSINYEIISQEILKHYPDTLVAVLIYGSFAKKKENQGSDIDIAVVLDRPEKGWKKRADITMTLSEVFPRKIDLVCFDSVSPVLRMQILKNNRIIFMNETKRIIYSYSVIRALTEYFDLKRARAMIENSLSRGSVYG